jgi:hypothetical protein
MTLNFRDLTGQVFGRLIVLRRDESSEKKKIQWICKCGCGNIVSIFRGSLTHGNTKSCGCLRRDVNIFSNTRHGRTDTPEYRSYSHAKTRCENTKDKNYLDYGGRGIKFLFSDFIEFYAHLGDRPGSNYTLDRIDVNGHYEPGNVRWATRSQQTKNRRYYGRSAFKCKNCGCQEFVRIDKAA